ncbi:CCA tRNA nucleotidyltransferase [Pseudogemmobacter humi]|uniref:CCA-adding enzyme n=1 Tax=Pseudogemmobacter humi TaxID=2483812 RepID=A0A3P5WR19_9RHOB|nr:CCA tRNA nucleotidyltransferase [Pseudogemmobacter humi]VDC23562.1 CCA-adding enzyme [Pseudogemmobacter humi]
MRITGDWLTRAGTQEVLAMLEAAGHRAWAVGGCVRNAILGEPVADVDISTDARPERVAALAAAAGLKCVPTGIGHGTVTVIAGHEPYEITTFRRDVETDGRRAVVAFADRIEDDAMRRDFTMNALYARRDGEVSDPLGSGIADALARRIRFVGEPGARIREDYLRILRFFRFLAWYGDPAEGPDPEGLAACAELADGIGTLSRERIGAEMKKLLSAPDPAPAVAAMAASGVLTRILPGADPRALPVLVHLENGEPPRWTRRLACLGGEGWRDLRLSSAETRSMESLSEATREGGLPAALGHMFGAEIATDAILARAALTGNPPPRGWRENIARGAAGTFPVTAADLMPGLSGPALGARLRALKQAWLASDLRLSRAALLALPEA